MATWTGYKYASSYADGGWTGGGNACGVGDSVYAYYDIPVGSTSPYIRLYNFGITTTDVPTGSVINAIEASVVAKGGQLNYFYWNSAQLYLGTTAKGTLQTGTSTNHFATTNTTVTYAPGTVWGWTDITDTDVRDSTFGVWSDFGATYYSTPGCWLDTLRIRIQWSPAPSSYKFFAMF